jgi:hypothetical protein
VDRLPHDLSLFTRFEPLACSTVAASKVEDTSVKQHGALRLVRKLGPSPDDRCRMFFRLIRLRRERRDDYAKSRDVSINPAAARNKRQLSAEYLVSLPREGHRAPMRLAEP